MKSSFFLSLLSFLLILNYLTPAAIADVIADTCKRCADGSPNVNYDICVSTLGSAPGSQGADLKGLGIIATKLTTASADRAHAKAQQLLDENRGNESLESRLNTCVDLYTNAVSSLSDIAGAIESGNYNDANVWLSSVVDAPTTCDDSFSELNIASLLAAENKELFQLSVTALGIEWLLQHP